MRFCFKEFFFGCALRFHPHAPSPTLFAWTSRDCAQFFFLTLLSSLIDPAALQIGSGGGPSHVCTLHNPCVTPACLKNIGPRLAFA